MTVETTTAPPGDTEENLREDVRIPVGLYPFHYNTELRPHIYRQDEVFAILKKSAVFNGLYLNVIVKIPVALKG